MFHYIPLDPLCISRDGFNSHLYQSPFLSRIFPCLFVLNSNNTASVENILGKNGSDQNACLRICCIEVH